MNKTSLILPVLILFVLFLVLTSGGDPALNSKTHHELCDDWFNSEQTEEDASTTFSYLGIYGRLDWTFKDEVNNYCNVLKGSPEEF